MNHQNKLIQQIINMNLDICQSDPESNDLMLHDLLMYGFKGLTHMSVEELENELMILKGLE